jgi:hypothetical protein
VEWVARARRGGREGSSNSQPSLKRGHGKRAHQDAARRREVQVGRRARGTQRVSAEEAAASAAVAASGGQQRLFEVLRVVTGLRQAPPPARATRKHAPGCQQECTEERERLHRTFRMDAALRTVGAVAEESRALKRARYSSDATAEVSDADDEQGPALMDSLVLELQQTVGKAVDDLRRLLSARENKVATLAAENDELKAENEELKAENEELKRRHDEVPGPDVMASQCEDHHEEQAQRLAEDQRLTREQRLQEDAKNHAAALDMLEKARSNEQRLRADVLILTEKAERDDVERRALRNQVNELQGALQDAQKQTAAAEGLRVEIMRMMENYRGEAALRRRPPCE